MNKEKLKICLRLVKEGHINETEFEQLMQTEKEYMSMPSDGTATSYQNLTQTWKKVPLVFQTNNQTTMGVSK